MWLTSTVAEVRLFFPLHLSRAGLCVRIVFSIIKGFCSAGGIPTAVCELLSNSYVKRMCSTTFSARNPLESFGIPWNPPSSGPGIPAKLSSAYRRPKAEQDLVIWEVHRLGRALYSARPNCVPSEMQFLRVGFSCGAGVKL